MDVPLCPIDPGWKKQVSGPSNWFSPSSELLEAWLRTTSNSTVIPQGTGAQPISLDLHKPQNDGVEKWDKRCLCMCASGCVYLWDWRLCYYRLSSSNSETTLTEFIVTLCICTFQGTEVLFSCCNPEGDKNSERVICSKSVRETESVYCQ